MDPNMDLYGDDRKLSELSDELNEFLDSGAFTPTSSDSGCGLDTYVTPGMDEDWLESFFEDPVLNDRMISDALQPPTIRHEHSYSLSNSHTGLHSPLTLCKVEPMDQEIDADVLTAAAVASTTASSATTTQLNITLDPVTLNKTTTIIPKHEPEEQHNEMDTSNTTSHHISHTETALATQQIMNCTRTSQPTIVHKQPTIILATTTQSTLTNSNSHCPNNSNNNSNIHSNNKHERLVLPKVNIKVEPQESIQGSPEHTSSYHSLDLPPTPPSSNTSDSEGGQSPTRSAPSSPVRQSSLRVSSNFTLSSISHSSLFSPTVSQGGVLMLTEEEKRTLVSEGYPIPQKLPLTKQEEKNLKKIRRKIKNKISAQESRRKKKEYLETLEKKVEVYNQENCDLKKKVESLENNNRSLLSQLQKLQSIVSKITKPVNSTQSSCLMVVVLCFAVFLGAYSPSNFSIGYSRAGASPSAIKMPMGPAVKGAQVDAYVTTKMRSRVLLSMKEEQEESEIYGPATPFSYRQMLVSFFHGSGGYMGEAVQSSSSEMSPDEALIVDPEMPKVHITEAQTVADANLHNETGEQKVAAQPSMHPDITANVPAAVENTSA